MQWCTTEQDGTGLDEGVNTLHLMFALRAVGCNGVTCINDVFILLKTFKAKCSFVSNEKSNAKELSYFYIIRKYSENKSNRE